MSDIDMKDLARIEKCLEAEAGWRLERKSNRVLWAYPPDKSSPPIKITTSSHKAARNTYVALRRWGLDLEPSRGAGQRSRKNTAPAVRPAVLAAPIKRQPAPPELLDQVPLSSEGWTLSDHALARAEKRHINIREILSALLRPTIVSPAKDSPGCELRQAGDVRLVVNPDRKVIVTVIDDNDSRTTLAGPGRPVSKFVKADLKPVPKPCPGLASPVPPAPADLNKPIVRETPTRLVSRKDIRSVTERVRTGTGRAGTFFGTWTPPKPKPDNPTLPFILLTPVISGWLSDIVIPRLRARPGAWAKIMDHPDPVAARDLAVLIRERIPEMESSVRGTAIHAMWAGERK